MNNEKLKSALKNCVGVKPCKDCDYDGGGFMHFPTCAVEMLKDALSTIETLEQENEKLKEKIERTTLEYAGFISGARQFVQASERNKSVIIKEFAERLKEKKHECGCNYRKKPVYAITEEKIDETYKEMVGDAE